MTIPINQNKQYVSYIRVSTDKQGDSKLGTEAQQRINSAYIQSVGGIQIKEAIEIETGTNKTRISTKQNLNLDNLLKKRPVLKELIEFCSKEKAILVVKDLSRLGRSQLLISYLMQAGVTFICADSPEDSPFILQIKAAVYEEEARLISKRTIEALQSKKARGEKLGNPNIGKVRSGGNQIAFQDSVAYYQKYANIILPIYDKTKSFSQTARELNSLNLKTLEGHDFIPMTVKRAIQRLTKYKELCCGGTNSN